MSALGCLWGLCSSPSLQSLHGCYAAAPDPRGARRAKILHRPALVWRETLRKGLSVSILGSMRTQGICWSKIAPCMSCMVSHKAHIYGSSRGVQRRTGGSCLDRFSSAPFLSAPNPRDTIDVATNKRVKRSQRLRSMALCSTSINRTFAHLLLSKLQGLRYSFIDFFIASHSLNTRSADRSAQ